ncbi:5-oxoprolinase subunit PxpB [soil metagenome]
MATEIRALGESALVVRVGESLGEVLRTRQKLVAAKLPGVIEVAPALASVAVFFETPPDLEAAAETVRTTLRKRISAGQKALRPRKIAVPVCYETEFGPDLQTVAEQSELQPDEVVRRHAAARYQVACLGFTPGFPYLHGLPARLATPRLSSPRTRVAAGSVAIGGKQAGIYPQASPGGWNIVGRTPLRLFDLARTSPTLLRPGDRVRFFPITREEFEKWEK